MFRLVNRLGNISRHLSSIPPVSKANPISVIHHPHAINGVPIEASPVAEKFAVVALAGTQYKITVDDVLVANKINGVNIGETFEIKDVLLVGSRKTTLVGQPSIAGAVVRTIVEEQAKDRKVIIFKMRRRKNSRRTKGFRRQVTTLRVTDIILNAEEDALL